MLKLPVAESSLPKFASPPVVEVALSIMFASLPRYRSAHAGRLWHQLKDQFPITEDQPEIAAAVEEPTAPAAPPRLELMERPRLRTWFQSRDGTQLLQLQHDRIAYNWKKGESGEPYPSYEAVEKRFRELLPIVLEFISREQLGDVVPTQAEVTYVNHIRERHSDFARVFTLYRGAEHMNFLPAMRDLRFHARYSMDDDKGQMWGRLTADMQPAFIASDRTEILRLNMIARGKPLSPSIDSALDFLRIGHQWIVLGFAEITTPEMHAKWNRKQ